MYSTFKIIVLFALIITCATIFVSRWGDLHYELFAIALILFWIGGLLFRVSFTLEDWLKKTQEKEK